ncbi:hypothetical protein HOE04_00495 [archaeon]|jgi:hypothetical protein|nr:hypothetical protein [archaeon]
MVNKNYEQREINQGNSAYSGGPNLESTTTSEVESPRKKSKILRNLAIAGVVGALAFGGYKGLEVVDEIGDVFTEAPFRMVEQVLTSPRDF